MRELAAAARVSLAHLSEIERGRSEASSEVLSAICSALGVDLLELLASLVSRTDAQTLVTQTLVMQAVALAA